MLSCVMAPCPEILMDAALNNFFVFHRWSVPFLPSFLYFLPSSFLLSSQDFKIKKKAIVTVEQF